MSEIPPEEQDGTSATNATPAETGRAEGEEAHPSGEPSGLAGALDGPDWASTSRRRTRTVHGGAGDHPRRRRRSRRTVRRRRRFLAAGGLVVLAAIAVAAWLAYSAAQAKHDLEAVRDGVHQLRQQISSGDLTAARVTARDITDRARDAHDDTTGPIWKAAAAIPGLGDPFDTARTITSSVDLLAGRALNSLVDASEGLSPAHLRRSDGSFDLSPLEALAPKIVSAQSTLRQALTELHGASGSTWSGSINTARTQLMDEIQQLQPTLASAHRTALLVPPILGADGPRSYMLIFETGAEIRATGGIAGAFAIVRADHGHVAFTRFESDGFLVGQQVHLPSLGPRFFTLFQVAQEDFRDTNYGPHFPYAAQIWTAMYKQKTGQALDGAIALDPTTLSYLLGVTGPVTLQDGTQLNAGNVVALTQNTIYSKYPALSQNEARKQYQLDVARTISQHLLSATTDVTTLIKAAGRAADEHRLLMWTSDSSVEKQLADVPLGGAVPTDRVHPYLAVGLNNGSQSKLDYWLHAKVTWQRTSCSTHSMITVTIALTNDAPPGKDLPAYVVGASDPPGENSTDVVVYGSVGGQIISRTIDGKQPQYIPGTDRGHAVNIVTADVPRGGTTTLVMRLREPYLKGAPVVRSQPMINPMQVSVLDACS